MDGIKVTFSDVIYFEVERELDLFFKTLFLISIYNNIKEIRDFCIIISVR